MPYKHVILSFLLLAAPASAQIPNDFATADQVASEGYFTKCANGDIRACSLFARLVAFRLNPTANPSSWGWLSKNPGESGQDGYADDAIVYSADPSNLTNVIDLVGGSGAPGARLQWGGPNPRRPNNQWVAPRALTSAELEYLKPGAGGTPTPGPAPPPTPAVNLKPVLDALDAISAKVDALTIRVDAVASIADAAREQAEQAKVNASDVLHDPAAGLPGALAEIRAALARAYRGQCSVRPFGGSCTITLTPQ